MVDALYVAATGMRAHQAEVDVISNNVANVTTVGFRRESVSFSALTAAMAAGSVDPAFEATRPATAQPGSGTVGEVVRSSAAGELKPTGEPLNVAIDGAGFIEVLREDGSSAYTRAGMLGVNADGLLATAAGRPLATQIAVPTDAVAITIGTDGRVMAQLSTDKVPTELGKIELTSFANSAALTPLGDSLFGATPEAGEPSRGQAGENGLGAVRQGFLESSNVNMSDEMVSLMIAQRAFEMNSRVFQVADQMLSLTNSLAHS